MKPSKVFPVPKQALWEDPRLTSALLYQYAVNDLFEAIKELREDTRKGVAPDDETVRLILNEYIAGADPHLSLPKKGGPRIIFFLNHTFDEIAHYDLKGLFEEALQNSREMPEDTDYVLGKLRSFHNWLGKKLKEATKITPFQHNGSGEGDTSSQV